MLSIYKITSDTVVDFAAEELKKYLRMMMTEGGDIKIAYDPAATDGFRLGLMQDFGLDVSDVKNTELDDIIYIDTDTAGGIIAGDNPRSVLFAVYEYLRKNGCRWLFPGVDGEYIPLKEIEPVQYRHVPSCRHRAQCNEGGNIQQNLLECIDFAAKLGFNDFLIQFRTPPHYDNYYLHKQNPTRAPEPLSLEGAAQFKIACEIEFEKRGIRYHNVGHGWTGDSFVNPEDLVVGWTKVNNDEVPDQTKQYLAMIDGKREFYTSSPACTNFCMSNKDARSKVIDYIVDYTKAHSNTDYMHVWLADAIHSFCECDACRKKSPSDWYVVLMNELDEVLTQQGLANRIALISYVDTLWAPDTEVLKNPDRFALICAPITRDYSSSPKEETVKNTKLLPYELNRSPLPTTLEEHMAHFDNWQRAGAGSTIAFEYHFWRYQVHSASGLSIARSLHDDILFYRAHGFDGMMSCGTQRCFFPTGFAFYTYARTMFDASLTLEDIKNDYFPHYFGKSWREFYDYLVEVEQLLPHSYLALKEGVKHYKSEKVAKQLAENLDGLLAKGKALIEANYNSDVRVQTVAVRVMEHYLVYLEYLAEMMKEKALGNDERAMEIFEEFRTEMGKREIYIRTHFDPYTLFSEIARMAARKEDTPVSVFYD
ncbi:MAG: DUF4838 domain-containing protein [Clostridia bacterium]|nr:DUF4838 domain-containing protein [Clostridia bacterium]